MDKIIIIIIISINNLLREIRIIIREEDFKLRMTKNLIFISKNLKIWNFFVIIIDQISYIIKIIHNNVIVMVSILLLILKKYIINFQCYCNPGSVYSILLLILNIYI